MSEVYAATHRNGKAVAIKALHAHLAGNGASRRRFLREGYIANRIAHEGVVSVVDDDMTDDGTVFLVMDLLDGRTLEQHCQERGGVLPANEVLAVADAVLDVLIAAHAQQIVHRDVKPSNVFLTTRGTMKLLDFGIASFREMSASASATRTGFVLGTPGFIAPEQARGRWKEIDARTDLWSVGALMFKLLSGRTVHEGETINETVIAAATEDAPSLASVATPVPEGVAKLVDRALLKKPTDRWATAADMQRAVRDERAKLPAASLSALRSMHRDASTLDEASSLDAGARLSNDAQPLSVSSLERVRSSGVRRSTMFALAVAFVGLLALVASRAGQAPADADRASRAAASWVSASVVSDFAPLAHEEPLAQPAFTNPGIPSEPAPAASENRTARPAAGSRGPRRAPPREAATDTIAPRARLEDVLDERQ
jgi:serine/threonine-protein kinase